MHRELDHLLLFSDLGEDEILVRLAEVFRDWEKGGWDRDELTGRIYRQIKRLLDLSTECGFDAIHLFRERPECSTMVPIEDKLKAVLPYMVKRGLKIKFGKKA